jgi:hypothetical protein
MIKASPIKEVAKRLKTLRSNQPKVTLKEAQAQAARVKRAIHST